jgi:iron complex outermembrane receptor protein
MLSKRLRNAAFAVAALVVFLSQLVNAQASPAKVSGTIQDASGSVIAGVHVTLLNSAAIPVASASTNAEGRFALAKVAAGSYTLTADFGGFESLRREVTVSLAPVELTLTLRVRSVRQSVEVTAPASYVATDAAAGTKVNLPLMETPVAVAVIPQQVLLDQQTVNLVDALINVSGVAATNDSYGTSDSFSIRGFDAMSLLYQDGMKLDEYSGSGFAQDMANVEEVQVVKGPASVLYGQAEPGGLVEVITKKPQAGRFANLGQQFGSHQFFRTTADVDQPLIGKQLLARLVVSGTDANSFRNFVHTNEFNLYPSLSWRASKRFDFTLQSAYQTGSNYLDNGIPLVLDSSGASATPVKVPYSSNFVDYGANRSNNTQYSLKPTIQMQLAENWQLRLQYKFESINEPTPVDEYYTGDVDASGNLARAIFTSPRFRHRFNHVLADVPGKFSLGAVKNNFLIGFDFYKESGGWFGNTSLSPATINVFAPVYNQPYGTPDPSGDIGAVQGWTEYGAYIQDVAELPGRVFVLGGVRLNWSEQLEDYTFGTPVNSTYSTDVHDRPATPRAGLLWRPKPYVSFYASFTANYGASALGATSASLKFLPPESADQVEFGVKTEWLNRRLTASTAVYRIIKHNIPTADPKNPGFSEAIGTARTQGIEFDVAGQPTRSLRLIAGYSCLQALTTTDNNSPSLQGQPFPSVPHYAGSVWGTWEPQQGALHGLRAGLGIQTRSGEQAYEYVSAPPLILDRISHYTTVSMMGGWEHGVGRMHLSAQINIGNLLNTRYFSNVNPSQAMPGAPFSFLPALQVKF